MPPKAKSKGGGAGGGHEEGDHAMAPEQVKLQVEQTRLQKKALDIKVRVGAEPSTQVVSMAAPFRPCLARCMGFEQGPRLLSPPYDVLLSCLHGCDSAPGG